MPRLRAALSWAPHDYPGSKEEEAWIQGTALVAEGTRRMDPSARTVREQDQVETLEAGRVDVHGELEQTVGVAPLVVVPRHQLDEVVVEADARLGIEDGRAAVALGGDEGEGEGEG
eukprot:scaffold13312_cov63-Phaeocystis_antarctica.AAC.2